MLRTCSLGPRLFPQKTFLRKEPGNKVNVHVHAYHMCMCICCIESLYVSGTSKIQTLMIFIASRVN